MSKASSLVEPYIINIIIILVSVLALFSFYLKNQSANMRIVKNEAVLHLESLGAQIDARVGQMKMISKSLANDAHIHAWLEGDFAKVHESTLVDKLRFYVNEYDLTSTSFADKNTHKYWNHEGFLRKLNPEIDTWYYRYLASNDQDLISIYHDKNKNRVDLYVNYQQSDSNGLSGIATSFNSVLDKLNESIFAQYGKVYLADRTGTIHMQSAGEKVAQNLNLTDIFGEEKTKQLLGIDSYQVSMFLPHKTRVTVSSYIPNMDWYVVADFEKAAFLP